MTRLAANLVCWVIYTLLLAVAITMLPLVLLVCLLTDEDLFEKGRGHGISEAESQVGPDAVRRECDSG